MFVVVWEPKRGTGGGHQLVMDKQKAERISRVLYRALPDAEIRVMTAAEHAAAAVTEQQQRDLVSFSGRRLCRADVRAFLERVDMVV